jgi:hypothetical protein
VAPRVEAWAGLERENGGGDVEDEEGDEQEGEELEGEEGEGAVEELIGGVLEEEEEEPWTCTVSAMNVRLGGDSGSEQSGSKVAVTERGCVDPGSKRDCLEEF